MKLAKKLAKILLVGLIAVTGLAACGSSDDKTTSSNTSTPEKTVYTFGEEVTGKTGMAMIVHSMEETTDTGNEWITMTEGKKHVVFDVTITNKSDKALPYNSFYFEGKSDQGIESSIALSLLDGTIQSGELDPDDLVRGKVVLEFPEDAVIKTFVLTDAIGSKDIEIKFS